jgi:hypothetical protein
MHGVHFTGFAADVVDENRRPGKKDGRPKDGLFFLCSRLKNSEQWRSSGNSGNSGGEKMAAHDNGFRYRGKVWGHPRPLSFPGGRYYFFRTLQLIAFWLTGALGLIICLV